MIGFWLLLSGHYTILMLFFMVISVALVVWLNDRMESAKYQIDPVLRSVRIIHYIGWLVFETVKSSIDVAMRVWGLKPIKPAIRRFPAPQKTELGKTIYANSITLTPGTLTIGLDNETNELLIHAIHEDLFKDIEEGTMERKVSRLEGK
jgi:multicomponent Na+:H+ antiporter subunit E